MGRKLWQVFFLVCVCGSVQVTNLGGIQNNLKRVSRPRSSACNRRGHWGVFKTRE